MLKSQALFHSSTGDDDVWQVLLHFTSLLRAWTAKARSIFILLIEIPANVTENTPKLTTLFRFINFERHLKQNRETVFDRWISSKFGLKWRRKWRHIQLSFRLKLHCRWCRDRVAALFVVDLCGIDFHRNFTPSFRVTSGRNNKSCPDGLWGETGQILGDLMILTDWFFEFSLRFSLIDNILKVKIHT